MPKERVGISSQEGIKSVVHVETSRLFCQACPIHFWVCESGVEGDRAHGSLILLSGGEGVEMPELSTPCTWVLADLQSLPEQSYLQTLTHQVQLIFLKIFLTFFFLFFLNMQKSSPNCPKLTSLLTCCLTPLWCQILF